MRKNLLILVLAMTMSLFASGCNSKPATDLSTIKKSTSGGDLVVVVMDTSMGKIEIELNRSKAPITVKNFLRYADEGFYNGTIFHRVISSFMIQGGGFTKDMGKKKTHAPIKNEANNGLSNSTGTIAMARTGIVDSATAQFFINVKNNSNLDYKGDNPSLYGYCVFGKVISGMDVVNKIRNVATGRVSYYGDVPLKTIFILSVKRK